MEKEAPIYVFLMETKLSTNQLNAKKQHWDYNQGLVISSDGQSGGLALLWKPGTQVPVNVMRFGHSCSPLVGLIIYHGFVLETLMRSEANFRKLKGV